MNSPLKTIIIDPIIILDDGISLKVAYPNINPQIMIVYLKGEVTEISET
jgi:hypothetical protein